MYETEKKKELYMEESLTKKWYAVEKYQLDLGQIFPPRFSIYDTYGNVIILCSKYEKMNELNRRMYCIYSMEYTYKYLVDTICIQQIHRRSSSIYLCIHRCIERVGRRKCFQLHLYLRVCLTGVKGAWCLWNALSVLFSLIRNMVIC